MVNIIKFLEDYCPHIICGIVGGMLGGAADVLFVVLTKQTQMLHIEKHLKSLVLIMIY